MYKFDYTDDSGLQGYLLSILISFCKDNHSKNKKELIMADKLLWGNLNYCLI